MINDCTVDQLRLGILGECMGKHFAYKNLPREYEWNVISNQAVVYSCGMIGREDENFIHCHDANELEQCQRLASEVTNIMADEYMVDDEGDHQFSPFYVTANEYDNVPERITEDIIRSAFGGLIYPPVEILIEPLEEDTNWWKTIYTCAVSNWEDEESDPPYLMLWRDVINWFGQQSEIYSPVFVHIGRGAIRGEDGGSGCVFPRLAVGLSRKGSLVGMFTCVTHT
jgi:hypothetical protein